MASRHGDAGGPKMHDPGQRAVHFKQGDSLDDYYEILLKSSLLKSTYQIPDYLLLISLSEDPFCHYCWWLGSAFKVIKAGGGIWDSTRFALVLWYNFDLLGLHNLQFSFPIQLSGLPHKLGHMAQRPRKTVLEYLKNGTYFTIIDDSLGKLHNKNMGENMIFFVKPDKRIPW